VGYGRERDNLGYILPLWGPHPNGALTSSGRALHWEQANRSGRPPGGFPHVRTQAGPVRMIRLHSRLDC